MAINKSSTESVLDKDSGLACWSLGEGGQALLVVVLVMVVALTVGLSLTARSIINIRTSTEEADSQKALAAAEAGIEKALQINQDTIIADQQFSENNTTYSTTITEVKGTNAFLLNGGNLILQDDGVDIWLVSHNADGTPDYSIPSWTGDNINIYWGDPSFTDDCDNAAIEIAVISGTKATPSSDRYVYDPCASRRGSNNFNNPGGGGPFSIDGKQFKYKTQNIDAEDGLVARIVPIYANTLIAVDGDGDLLPTQGFMIDSTGKTGVGDRQVVHRLDYFRTFSQVPTIYFMYGLFSP